MTGSYIQRPGKIIAIEDEGMLVSVPRETSCCACKSRPVCGASLLQSGSERQLHVSVADQSAGLMPGDSLHLEMSRARLTRLICLAYVVPAILLLAGAAAAGWLWPSSEMAGVGGALLGLGIGCLLLRRYDSHPVASGLLPRVRVRFDPVSWIHEERAGSCESN
jgi:positive regulator of sigma E activity